MSGDEFKGTPEGLPNNDISTPVPPKRGKKLSGGEAPRARKTKRAEEPAKPQAEYAPSPEEADSSGPDPRRAVHTSRAHVVQECCADDRDALVGLL
jgi:hypothetical protein